MQRLEFPVRMHVVGASNLATVRRLSKPALGRKSLGTSAESAGIANFPLDFMSLQSVCGPMCNPVTA